MSVMNEIQVKGKRDFGTITLEEIVNFCIENEVNRINSMHSVYELVLLGNDKCDEEVLTSGSILEMVEEQNAYQKDTTEIRQTDRWCIDFN